VAVPEQRQQAETTCRVVPVIVRLQRLVHEGAEARQVLHALVIQVAKTPGPITKLALGDPLFQQHDPAAVAYVPVDGVIEPPDRITVSRLIPNRAGNVIHEPGVPGQTTELNLVLSMTSNFHFGPDPWPIALIPAGTAGIQPRGREPEPANRPESDAHHADGDLDTLLNSARQGRTDKA